jgi:hypothetical protein
MAIVAGLWATRSGERFSFEGVHYWLLDCPAAEAGGARRACR